MNRYILAALHKIIAKDLNYYEIGKEIKAKFFPELRGPRYQIVNDTIPKWLGRAESKWDRNTGKLLWSKVKLQKAILNDEKTLRRIITHELIHCWEYQTVPFEDIKRMHHGDFFHKYAAIINKEMGKDYVTVTSDESFVVEQTKPFYILIWPWKDNNFACNTFIRPTKTMKEVVTKRIIQNEAHVYQSRDKDLSNAITLKKYGYVTVFKNEDLQEKLATLYGSGDELDDKFKIHILGLT